MFTKIIKIKITFIISLEIEEEGSRANPATPEAVFYYLLIISIICIMMSSNLRTEEKEESTFSKVIGFLFFFRFLCWLVFLEDLPNLTAPFLFIYLSMFGVFRLTAHRQFYYIIPFGVVNTFFKKIFANFCEYFTE